MTQDSYAPAAPPTPAPMGRRVGAAIIDIIVLIVISVIFTAIFGDSTNDDNGTSFQLTGLPFVVMLLIGIGYYVVPEALQGQTLGKMALGLRAVGEDGKPLTWGTSLIRNLLRIVDGLFIYLVGFIIAMTNDRRQRLGDMVAKTIVVQN